MKVDSDLEVDPLLLSQPTRRCLERFRQLLHAASVGKSLPDNFWLIWVGIPMFVNVHAVHLKARSPEKLMDVSVFTKMVLCPAAWRSKRATRSWWSAFGYVNYVSAFIQTLARTMSMWLHVREELNLHPFFTAHVTDGMRSLWELHLLLRFSTSSYRVSFKKY